MNPTELASSHFLSGYNCSQAVLLAFAEALGLSADSAARIAAGFGGGLGRSGNACGAVTGAMMVIGLRYGSAQAEDKDSKERTYRIVQEFFGQFRAKFGSINCRDLLGVDMSQAGGHERARELGLFTTRCPLIVAGAVETLALLDAQLQAPSTAH